jgi:serine protease Do
MMNATPSRLSRECMEFIKRCLLLCCMTGAAMAAPKPKPAPAAPAASAATAAASTPAPASAETPPPDPLADASTVLPPPSSAAQKLYSTARIDLLQIRMLLKNGRTQSSVGSGFLVGTGNLVLTNYHVVSQMALDPDVYVGQYVDTDGKSGPIELLAVDVLHDLAVVRINRKGSGVFNIPEKLSKLTQGQYLYSLGNPLDLGFAISEGSYNGVITRSFYDQLMFTGPINSGMSGGPSVTISGEVAGVNVSKRRDGESVSFLVPVRYAQELLARVAGEKAPPKDFNILIGQQLLAHQRGMIDRLLGFPLTLKPMGPYLAPVRESEQMRCWGRSNVQEKATYTADIMSCSMESAIFVSDTQQTGHLSVTHQYIHSDSLDPLRFAALATKSFNAGNAANAKGSRLTAPSCTERFIKTNTLPLRAVLCVRAYRKFEGLYNFILISASTDSAKATFQTRLDVTGVSYENGMRTTRAFLDAMARGDKQ